MSWKCTYWDPEADLWAKQTLTSKKLRQKVGINSLHQFQPREYLTYTMLQRDLLSLATIPKEKYVDN